MDFSTLTLDQTLPQDEGPGDTHSHSHSYRSPHVSERKTRRLSPPAPENVGPAQRAVLQRLGGSDEGSTYAMSVTRSMRTVSPARTRRSPGRSPLHTHSRCCQAAHEETQKLRHLHVSLQAEVDALRAALTMSQSDHTATLEQLDRMSRMGSRESQPTASESHRMPTDSYRGIMPTPQCSEAADVTVEVQVETANTGTMTDPPDEEEERERRELELGEATAAAAAARAEAEAEAAEAAGQMEIELTHAQEYSVLLEQRTEELQMRLRRLETSKEESEEVLRQEFEDRERRIRQEYEAELRSSNDVNESQKETARKIQDALKEKLEDAQDTVVDQASDIADLKAASRREVGELESRIRDLRQQVEDAQQEVSAAEQEKETQSAQLQEEIAQLQQRSADEEGEKDAVQARLEEEQQSWASERERLHAKKDALEQGRSELTALLSRIRAEHDKLKAENNYLQAQFQASIQASQQPVAMSSRLSSESEGARQGAMGLDLDANTLTVTRVVPGGPSHVAGVKKGDVIVAIQTENDLNPVPVECVHVLRNALSISGGVADGSTVYITAQRKHHRKTFPLTLVRDDGSVANTMMRHLKELKMEHRTLNIKLTTKLATSEAALQDALRKVLPMPPDRHISYDALLDCLGTFNASLGLPVFNDISVGELYHACTPGMATLHELFPRLKELFYSSLRGLELGE
eukprot:TRINITY_DN12144_c0_g2_i1.p1 TRINITY_DN12144_c0_g2~~TRINITY_DN12144_c0_g2_i1.p1  ORF type:complete len:693 (+),score=170.19 TRINITY_DN12144_c0_g2_i1:90-2168(+)